MIFCRASSAYLYLADSFRFRQCTMILSPEHATLKNLVHFLNDLELDVNMSVRAIEAMTRRHRLSYPRHEIWVGK